ncbi:MAG: Trx7/PDZ domain-containing (seleno)protein [Gemmataceae bacterium]
MTRHTLFPVLLVASTAFAQQTPRDLKVQADKTKVEAAGFWVYNDFAKAVAEAKASGRPILAVLRCIPCEECVKLDDDLVNEDPRVRPLLEKFVRVRIVSTNGLDLSMFQFDTDQSFAAFLLNADGTIYGRFGTRSHRTSWADDVSIDGLAKALQAALDLHAGYPANKAAFAGKRGPTPEFASPEKDPALKDKFTSQIDYKGGVARSCIHCHQIGDAAKSLARSRGLLSDEVLFPYPHPKALGLVLDPKEKATILRVEPGSPAEASGFHAGDAIAKLDRQPLVSMADVQWVLHRSPPGPVSIKADVVRGGTPMELTLSLPDGWRHRDDLSWRASSWGLRRMALGGLLLETKPTGELAVKRAAQANGPHGTAYKAGFRTGDIIVEFDGLENPKRETDLFAHALTKRRPGESVSVKVVRNGATMTLPLVMQE